MDGVTDGLEQVADGCAVGCMAAVADVQGTGRICGYELEQDAWSPFRGMPAVILALVEDRLYLCVEGRRAQVEIDETGAGDLDLLQLVGVRQLLRDGGSDIAGAAARRLGEPHRNVGCEVTMRGIAGALDRALSLEPPGRVSEVGQAGQSVVEKFRYRGLH